MEGINIKDTDLYKAVQNKGNEDFEDEFRKKLNEAQQKYSKDYKPYCSACAWIDFRDTISKMKNEVERQLGFGPGAHLPDEMLSTIKEFKALPDTFNYDKYAAGWNLKAEAETREMRVSPVGEKFNVVTGYHMDYSCNRYGHGNSVWMDCKSHDDLKGKTKL